MAVTKWQRNRDMGVPLAGDLAFRRGYSARFHNPHAENTPDHRFWLADWWRANGEAFLSHISSGEEQ